MPIHRIVLALMVLTATLSVAPEPAACQDRTDSMMVARITPSWNVGAVGVQLGTAHLGLGNLNDALTSNGRPSFSADVATIGVSAYARFGWLMLGGSGETALPQRRTTPVWTNRITFGSATIDAGVAIIERPRILVQSQLSFGLRKTSMRMEQRGDFAFEDGVGNPARNLELSSLSALGGVGVMAEMRFATRVTGEFAVGLRAAIHRPLGAAATWAGESRVTGAAQETDGRYLRISVGKPIGRRREVVSSISTALLTLLTQ